MERRTSLEIVLEILKLARHGARKTAVVYGANLNFKMLMEYAEKLQKKGFIRINGDGMLETTDLGKKCYDYFRAGLIEFGL